MKWYWLMWSDADANPQQFRAGMVSTYTKEKRPAPWKSGTRPQLLAALAASETQYDVWRLAHPVDKTKPTTRLRATDGRVYVVNGAGKLVLE